MQAIALTQQPQVMYNLTVAGAHTFFVGAARVLVHNTCPGNIARGYPKDYTTRNTKNWSGWFESERHARQLAREKLGHDPVETSPNKWRSRDGKWQYRAKPEDLDQKHIHLEELDPVTGEILQNLHLRWK